MRRRILFVGELTPYSRSHQRLDALIRLGHVVRGVSYAGRETDNPEDERPTIVQRVWHRLGRPRDRHGVNAAILNAAAREPFDLVWVDKGLCVRGETLRRVRQLLPGIQLVFGSDDDMFGRHNQSAYFRECLPLYDVVFTAKSFNARPEELPALGARRCLYFPQGFDPTFHRPVAVDDATRERLGAPVAFIGTFEEPRARALLAVAVSGVRVKVFGNGWEAWRGRHPKLEIQPGPVYGEEYVRAVCASDVQLGFLRKKNRDLHTSRSLDIPACGSFFLAERTDEHEELYREGIEADYFDVDDHEELCDRIAHALADPARRERIAEAGRQRALTRGYSHDARLAAMLAEVPAVAEAEGSAS